MNDITIIILFKDGTNETIDCWEYEVENGCLSVGDSFGKTRIFPLDNIKEITIL